MARRMTDTEKWEDDWFMNLSPSSKLLWFYLCDQCDHAGIWKVNHRLAEFRIGCGVPWADVIAELGDRIQVLEGGDRWHVRKFVEFQYGPTPNEKNNAHAGVMKVLRSFSLSWSSCAPAQPLTSPSLGALDTDKDKDSRESAERGATKADLKARFRDLLVRLVVADGPVAARKWFALASSSKHTRSFEDQCDLVKWCVETARERGVAVEYAAHVMALVPEWRPKPDPQQVAGRLKAERKSP